LMREVRAVSAAIKAYAETIGQNHPSAIKNGRTKTKSRKRTMSAATKRKLSLAAKARWTKVNAKKS
jgi:hypothetical protein